MGGNKNLSTILLLIGIHLMLQVFVFRLLVPYNVAFGFLYVSIILFLPLNINPLLLLIMAFGVGLTVDIFENTLGINAAATVFTAYMRPYALKLLFGKSGSKEELTGFVTVGTLGLRSYSMFAGILVFIHCIVFFILEAAHWGLFFQNFDKVIFSTIYTISLVIITQMLVFSSRFQR